MFELFLNAARFAVSEDMRKSAAGIIELITRSPEWQHNICTLEIRVGSSFAEQAFLLNGLTTSKMVNLHYDLEAIEAFRTSYHELVRNAFEHGCGPRRKGIISIRIDITQDYVALTVLNSKGVKFDLAQMMHIDRLMTLYNPDKKRGRGLILVYELADTLRTENNQGVKAVFYRARVSFEVTELDRLVIIRLSEGLFNPSIDRRLLSIAERFMNYDLILDFSDWMAVGSDVWTRTLELRDLYAKSSKKVVALLYRAPKNSEQYKLNVYSAVSLPSGVVVYSWLDALMKVGRLDLLPKIRQLKSRKKRK